MIISKVNARKLAFKQLKDLDNNEILANDIINKLKNNSKYLNAQVIGIYYPIKFEIDLLVLTEDNKRFAFPKINKNNEIDFIETNNETLWEMNKFNILEPKNGKIINGEIELLIIPVVAVNDNNVRLGYGGGYYDKFITKYPNIKSIGILPKLLKYNFSSEDHDLKLDEIITGGTNSDY